MTFHYFQVFMVYCSYFKFVIVYWSVSLYDGEEQCSIPWQVSTINFKALSITHICSSIILCIHFLNLSFILFNLYFSSVYLAKRMPKSFLLYPLFYLAFAPPPLLKTFNILLFFMPFYLYFMLFSLLLFIF